MLVRKPFILCCSTLVFVIAFLSPLPVAAQEADATAEADEGVDANNSDETVDEDEFPSLDDFFGNAEAEGEATESDAESPDSTGSLDDLFATPDEELESTPEEVEVIDLDAIGTDERPRVSGRVSSRGGINLGLRNRSEWEDGADDPGDVLDAVGLFDIEMLARVDYRPNSYQRFFASVKTEVDHDTLEFTTPAVDELFVDYIIRRDYFFRAGRQSLTWGQARLLQNEANFVSKLNEGIGLRAFAPLRSGLTSVIYTTEEYLSDAGGSSGYKSYGYAGLFETALGRRNSLGFSSYFRYEQPLRTAAYVITSFGEFDLALEGVTDWDTTAYYDTRRTDDLDPRFVGLVSAFWESTTRPRVRLIAEYQYDSEIAEYQGHRVGLGSQLSGLSWTRWALNLRWRHEFSSGSGDALVAFEGPVAPGITAGIGVPVFYQDPEFVELTEEEEAINEFTVSTLLTLSMTIEF